MRVLRLTIISFSEITQIGIAKTNGYNCADLAHARHCFKHKLKGAPRKDLMEHQNLKKLDSTTGEAKKCLREI